MNEAALTQLLNGYFNARDSEPSLVTSPTLAAIERAKTRGATYSACSACDGDGSTVVQLRPRIEIPCLRCGGAKRVPRYGAKAWAAKITATLRCPACRGACKTHRAEFLAAGRLDPVPVGCWCCGGAGYLPRAYAVPTGTQSHASASPRTFQRSRIHRLLDSFRAHDSEAYAVLELVYGERGQQLQLRRQVCATQALWPHIRSEHGEDRQTIAAMLLETSLWILGEFDECGTLARYTAAVGRRGTWKEGLGPCVPKRRKTKRKSFRWTSTQLT